MSSRSSAQAIALPRTSIRGIRNLAGHLAPLAGLLAFTLLVYHQLAVESRVLADYDVLTYFYPNEQYAADSLRAGALPLWNPYLFTGVPFLANIQTALFYPPNLLFVLIAVPRAYALSVALHAFLAAAFAYEFGRHTLRLRTLPALVVGMVYALGGFFSAQAGHLNQQQASAWLPLLLLLAAAVYRQHSVRLAVTGSLAVAAQFLAGHLQEFYMTMVALALFVAWLMARDGAGSSRSRIFRSVAPVSLMLALGIALTAVQFLPTYELMGESIRAGGMSYKDSVSFSLPPWMLLRSLLPFHGDPAPYSEWIGYGGVVAVTLAIVALLNGRRRGEAIFFAVLVGLAIFLALGQFNPLYPTVYRVLPGLGLFRVPARWLLLYSFALAALAGLGVQALADFLPGNRRRVPAITAGAAIAGVAALFALALTSNPTADSDLPSLPTLLLWLIFMAAAVLSVVLAHRGCARRAAGLAALLVAAELFIASQGAGINRTSVPEAFSAVRPAVAHLQSRPGLFRVLALSEATFDPGDIAELKGMLAPVLPADGVYDYIVATKHKETLTPNLPLAFRIPTLDGYDGGVLPLRRYVALKSLFPLASSNTPDGRLREQLTTVPDVALLNWLNVRYILMDRVRDTWVGGVYYDLALARKMTPGSSVELTNIPNLQSTAVGVISRLEGAATTADGTPVAELTITGDGTVFTATLRAGSDTAEGRYDATAAHRQARKAKASPDDRNGDPNDFDYVTTVSLPTPMTVEKITLRLLNSVGSLELRGASVIDERRAMSFPVVMDPNLQLTHLGDVKIYENRSALERGFLVHQVGVVNDGAVLDALRKPEFYGASEAVVAKEEWAKIGDERIKAQLTTAEKAGGPGDKVEIVEYRPERVSLETESERPSLLVLTDSYYPGWKATVDGQPAPVLRADHLFRAVALPAGRHEVKFEYEPFSLWIGAVISVAALAVVVLGLAWPRRR